MLIESCVMFIRLSEPLKALFCEMILRPVVNRERRENKTGSFTAGGRNLVLFKLELMLNHQNSHLENTGIQTIRYFSIPVPN